MIHMRTRLSARKFRQLPSRLFHLTDNSLRRIQVVNRDVFPDLVQITPRPRAEHYTPHAPFPPFSAFRRSALFLRNSSNTSSASTVPSSRMLLSPSSIRCTRTLAAAC